MGRRWRRRLGAVGLGLLAAAALLGQSPGAVAGRVRDAGGAALAGVALRALRLGAPAGSATRALSDAQGRYRLAGLAPGRYQLRAAKAGFLAQQRTLAVRAGATAGLDWVLAAARPGTAPALRQGTVENTPLNGRDWTQLATLRPGVSGVETENASQGHVAQRGFGAALSISGSRPEENDYLLDGISISDYANGAPGSVVGTTLGVDAVQRMTVLDNNYPAAYGRTGGGIISAATRSGGDAWHGSLYEFLRNSALDARNFFDASKPAFRRNQFGGSLGGRVRPLRLHLFGDYEGLRQSLGITHVDTVPSVAARAGQLASGPVAVDAQAAAFLRALYPLPNGPALGLGDTGVYTFSGQQTTGENFFTTRADTTRGGRQFSAIYLFDGSEVTQPDAFNALLSNVTSRRQMVALSEEQALGGWSSVARVGFSRAVALDGGLSQVLNPAFTNPALGMVPGQFVGSISVPGLTSLDGGPAAGTSRLGSSKSFAWNSFQESEDLSRSFGGQTVQLGARVERMQSNVGLAADSNGSFQFGSLAAFLTNQPQTFSAARPMPVPIMGTRETLFGAYVEDALQLRPRFQLSLGMRYEMTTVPTEAHHRIANLQALTDPVAQIGSPYFLNPTLHNFAPRLGLTWQPWRSGAVVRSGFGIFDVLPLPYLFNIVTPAAYPYFQEILGSTPGTGTFPTGAYQQLAGSPSSYRTSYVEHHPHRSYVMQWNFSLQQRLGRQWAAMVGYVGSRSVHLPFRTDDFNTVMPTPTPAGYLYPPAATSQRLNPNFGRINGIMWNADAYYEALQATLRGSWRSGLQMQASYTWGKTMDTSSASITADQYDNSLVNMPWFNTRLDRGLSDLNMGQNFVANFTWALPGQSTGPWGWALAGWQWVGVVKAASGTPFTPLLGGDPLGTKLNAASEVPNWVNGPGCGSRVNPGNPNDYIRSQCFAFPSPGNLKGNVGRNTLIGPGLANLDFSLIKNTAAGWLGGDSSVQLRAEFFNLLNRADFAPPLAHLAVFDASGNPVAGAGLITATVQPAREVQLAVKLLW